MTDTIKEISSSENRKEECSMLNLKVDQEFTDEKLSVIADAFIKCIVEILKTSTDINEETVSSLIQILLLKYFTNMSLPDDLMDIISSLKPIEDDICEIMKQFPEGQLLKVIEIIQD